MALLAVIVDANAETSVSLQIERKLGHSIAAGKLRRLADLYSLASALLPSSVSFPSISSFSAASQC